MLDTTDLVLVRDGDVLASLADLEPSPFVLSVLMTIDRTSLRDDDAVTYLRILERVFGWLASIQAEVLVAAAGREPRIEAFTLFDERTVRVEDAVREEIAAALRWSPVTTQHRIDTARLLAGPLAATHEALSLGEITSGHVAVIVEAAGRVPEESLGDLQCRVLPVARRGTLVATRAAARRAVLAIDADGARRRRLAARCTRDVYVVDDLDGISTLIARMATEDAHALMTAIDTRAAADESSAPIGERRAAALRELVLDSATDLVPGAGHAGRPAARRTWTWSSTWPPCSISPTTPRPSPGPDPCSPTWFATCWPIPTSR